MNFDVKVFLREISFAEIIFVCKKEISVKFHKAFTISSLCTKHYKVQGQIDEFWVQNHENHNFDP